MIWMKMEMIGIKTTTMILMEMIPPMKVLGKMKLLNLPKMRTSTMTISRSTQGIYGWKTH
jgi:hypothetical protein